MSENKDINVGGQAVIEGVMMRSKEYVSVAVRRQDGKIVVKRNPFKSFLTRNKLFKIPVVRGGIVLIESLILGVKALSWSAEVAMEEEEKKKEEKKKKKEGDSVFNKIWLGLSLVLGLGMGIALFFYLPLIATEALGIKDSIWFNLVDGAFRLVVFGLYLFLISLWKEFRRVFEYHGAEHKSIFAFENKKELTVDQARPYTTLHPRCGTSFLLIVMLVSIFVFIFLGKPDSVAERVIRFLFIPVIAGISYELIRLSGKLRDNKIARIFMLPGLWLQKVTTKEPDDEQLEVGLISLRSALGEDITDENVVHFIEKPALA